MPASIKTQCPHCHGTFAVPKNLLHDRHAKGRCRLCGHIFLLNKHLLASKNQDDSQSDDVHTIHKITPLTSQFDQNISEHQQQTTTLDDDILIHDDMEIDDDDASEAISGDYDDLDAMQAWLTGTPASQSSDDRYHDDHYHRPKAQASKTDRHTLPANTDDNCDYRNDNSSSDNGNNSSSDNNRNHHTTHSTFINNKPSSPTNPHPDQTSAHSDPVPSAQYNQATINTSNTSKTSDSDDNWLEKLLEEKSENDQKNTAHDQPTPSAAATSRVISEPATGVLIEPKSRVITPAAVQTSIASLLWLAGCVVLVLLLLAQYVTFNLDTLVKNPAYAARLQSICTLAACSLPHADISALEIDDVKIGASQIQSSANFSDIKATLVNQSEQTQLFPSLRVSIYDTNGVIGEFIADPHEYLLSPQRQIAAQYEQPVWLTVPLISRHIHHVTITPIY